MSIHRLHLAFAILALAAPASAQETSFLSVSSSGTLANGRSYTPAFSADETCVAFASVASNLVPGDSNGFTTDIFVRTLQTGQTVRVSVSSSGAEGNGSCGHATISADGRYVAFGSTSDNLVPNDGNSVGDVFLRDRASGLTERISVASSGVEGDLGSGEPVLSGDGSVVAFTSVATNLVPGDTNDAQDVFVRDRTTGQTTRVSVGTNGAQANAGCYELDMSADGRYVAFFSFADTLVPGDTNGREDIFVHDLQTGVTSRVSVGLGGVESDAGSWGPSLSADGRYVAFESVASNLVPGDTNGMRDIFVHDRATGTTTRVSVSSTGDQADDYCEDPSISADGRHVAFGSLASTLVPGDENHARDIFVHDRLLGWTVRSSRAPLDADPDEFSFALAISSSGRYVAYESLAQNLVAGDTNGLQDVFLHERPIHGGGVLCAGDGSAFMCPCANLGGPGEGCSSSLGHGALLGRYGSSRFGGADLRFAGEQLPPGALTWLFVGTTTLGGGQGIPFGDGLRGAGGEVVRLGTRVADVAGIASWEQVAATTGGWSVGETRTFQIWYLETGVSPCGAGFNTTPAHEVTFYP